MKNFISFNCLPAKITGYCKTDINFIKKISVVFLLSLFCLIQSNYLSAQVHWLGTSSDWSNTANWDSGMLPTNTTAVEIVFPSTGGFYPDINTSGTAICSTLTIDSGATVTIDTLNDLKVYGDIIGNNTFGKGNVIIANSDNLTGNFQFGNLTVNTSNTLNINGSVNIAGILINNGTINTSGNLTILSTATQTGMISGASTGSFNGNVNVQRYIGGPDGYHYISSPFSNSSAGDFANYASFPVIWGEDYQNWVSGEFCKQFMEI